MNAGYKRITPSFFVYRSKVIVYNWSLPLIFISDILLAILNSTNEMRNLK